MTAICPISFANKKRIVFCLQRNIMTMLSQSAFGLILNELYFLLKITFDITKLCFCWVLLWIFMFAFCIPWTILMIWKWVKYLLNDRHWTYNIRLTCTNIWGMATFQSSLSMLSAIRDQWMCRFYPIKIDIGHEIFKTQNDHDLPITMIQEHKAFISMSLGIQKHHNYM